MSKRNKGRQKNALNKSDFMRKQEITRTCEKYDEFLEFCEIREIFNSYGIQENLHSAILSIFKYNYFEYVDGKWNIFDITKDEFMEEYSESADIILYTLNSLIERKIIVFL
jgi:hypothetical protein